MPTKLMMTLSACLLAVTGLSLTFLPDEIAAFLGLQANTMLLLVLQLLGALYFALAMLNYMAKGSLIGGIYNRPICIANFTHFFVGGLALIKILLRHEGLPSGLWIAAGVYAVFALWFGQTLFRHPLTEHQTS
jgi:Na+-driven multidrug efflux pump